MGPITAPRPATSPAFRSNHRGTEKGTWYLQFQHSVRTLALSLTLFLGCIKHTLAAYLCDLFLCLLQNRQWSDEAAEMWSEPVLTNSHYSTSSLQRLDLNIASGARVSCSVTRDGCIAALPRCNPRTQEKTLLCCMSQCQFINVKFVQSLLMVIIRSNQSK